MTGPSHEIGKGRAAPTPRGALSHSSRLVQQALALPRRERLAFIEKNAAAIRREYAQIWGRLLSRRRSRPLSLWNVASDDVAGTQSDERRASHRIEPALTSSAANGNHPGSYLSPSL